MHDNTPPRYLEFIQQSRESFVDLKMSTFSYLRNGGIIFFENDNVRRGNIDICTLHWRKDDRMFILRTSAKEFVLEDPNRALWRMFPLQSSGIALTHNSSNRDLRDLRKVLSQYLKLQPHRKKMLEEALSQRYVAVRWETKKILYKGFEDTWWNLHSHKADFIRLDQIPEGLEEKIRTSWSDYHDPNCT